MFDFPNVMSVSNINPYCLQIMNPRRNTGQKRSVAAANNNQVPPLAPVEGVAMEVNPARLTDVEVRAYVS